MIVVVTPNPALDVTYAVGTLRPGSVHRVTPLVRPGGKGVNVARLLHRLGADLLCTGFAGGRTGAELRRLLEDEVRQVWIDIEGSTRTTTAVVESSGAVTMLNETGPVVDADAWAHLVRLVVGTQAHADALVLSGSLPPGPAASALPALLGAAHAHGLRTIVDTSGPALLAAARSGAALLKPNVDELVEATGTSSVADGAAHLLSLGAGVVVVSQGEAGLAAFTGGRAWTARGEPVLGGNATGAGDAVVAALARSLERAVRAGASDDPARWLPDALLDAVALSAAAVLSPVAGEVDLDTAHHRRRSCRLEETHAA